MAMGTRVSGILPVVGAVTSAVALTGLAFFAVAKAGCGDAGEYVYTGGQLELVGGCVDPGELPPADEQPSEKSLKHGAAADRDGKARP